MAGEGPPQREREVRDEQEHAGGPAQWARAFHRRVPGSQTRLANTTAAAPAIRFCRVAWRNSRKTAVTAAASTTVPITARVSRRVAGQAPVLRVCRRAGRNRATEPSGAATIPASNIA